MRQQEKARNGLPLHKANRNPNWINRGFALLSLVIVPAVDEVGTPPENCRLLEGRLKLTLLNTLKKSIRNWKRCVSPNGKFFMTPKSIFVSVGPVKRLRPTFPVVPAIG